MRGFFTKEQRQQIRDEQQTAQIWIGDGDSSGPGRVQYTARLPMAFTGSIFNSELPISSPSTRIGKDHDDDQLAAVDRTESSCPFTFAYGLTGRSLDQIAWHAMLPLIHDSPGLSLRDVWERTKKLEVYLVEMPDVRVGDLRDDPALRAGVGDLRRAPSHDPEYDPPDGAVLLESTGHWAAMRRSLVENRAAVSILGSRFDSTGYDVVIAVHPAKTLVDAEIMVYHPLGTLGSLMPKPWRLLKTRSTTGKLVIREHGLTILGGVVRRGARTTSRELRPFVDALVAIASVLENGRRIFEIVDWARGWLGLFRHPGAMTGGEIFRPIVLVLLMTIALSLVGVL